MKNKEVECVHERA